MASFTVTKPQIFFLFLVFFSTEARESKLFSKFTHYSTKNNIPESTVSSVPTSAPELAPAPAPAPTPVYMKSGNAHDLYGPGSGLLPPKETTSTTTTTTIYSSNNIDENELSNEELDDVNNENIYKNSNYNNNHYTNNYNNNGYKTEQQGTSDTRFLDGGEYYYDAKSTPTTGIFNKNGYKLSSVNYETVDQNNNYNNEDLYNYNKNGYGTEQQGMSDTRFMEGGKYYYDVSENQGYYGNTESSNEFNTMEEFENQEESLP